MKSRIRVPDRASAEGNCWPPPLKWSDVVHDWRLWQREKQPDAMGTSFKYYEVWYCTRCRLIEERNVEPA